MVESCKENLGGTPGGATENRGMEKWIHQWNGLILGLIHNKLMIMEWIRVPVEETCMYSQRIKKHWGITESEWRWSEMMVK